HGEAAGDVGGDHLPANLRGHCRRLAQHARAQPAVEAGPDGARAGLRAHQGGELGGTAFKQTGGLCDQAGKAEAAASAARRASWSEAAAAREATAPVSGWSRSKVAPPAAS